MTTVTLGKDQSAEPKHCGSCQHFRHRQEKYDNMGICSLKLPPWVNKRYRNPGESWEVDPRTVQDTDTCDFHKIRTGDDGLQVEFTQQRSWKAGTPSK